MTTADVVVLSLLAERAMHGYDLMSEYKRQEVADWASVSKAQLYYALRKLEDLGLVAGRSEAGISRDRTIFTPTPAGTLELGAALGDPGWSRSRVPQPFTTWYGLSMHAVPGVERAMLEARRDFLEYELERERRSHAFIVTLDGERARRGADIVRLVIRQFEVELDWTIELIGGL